MPRSVRKRAKIGHRRISFSFTPRAIQSIISALHIENSSFFTQKRKKVIILHVVQKCICLLQVFDQYPIKRKEKYSVKQNNWMHARICLMHVSKGSFVPVTKNWNILRDYSKIWSFRHAKKLGATYSFFAFTILSISKDICKK